MDKIILSIDCGTQSLRAMLFNKDGELLGKTQISYTPYHSKKPGWAEQDVNIYWDSLCEATKQLKRKHRKLFKQIAGVGVTTIRDTIVNVDNKGKVLRPAIVWMDERKAKRMYIPKGLTKLAYRAVGMAEAVLRMQIEGKCNWIMQNQPPIWKRTHKLLMVSGFLNFRLTGEFKDSVASQVGHIPFDYKKQRWSTEQELNHKLFPVDIDKLPELVKPGEIIGNITKEASKLTGIPEGLSVVACGSDKGCETIGMGVIDGEMASLSFGTTATVQTTTDKYVEAIKYMPAYPAAITGQYNPEVEIFRGYWMITWFKNEFGYKEVSEALDRDIPAEELLNKMLSEVPPGSMGLIVHPYWKPGLKFPSEKGAIIGFGDVHTRAHIYRAVIEGLAYGLKEGLQCIEKATGSEVKRLAVSGGASQSDEICKISADIFNLELVRGKTHETSGLGAAIIASVGLGLHDSYKDAIKKMVKYGRVFVPNPTNVELYDKLFKRVYKKIFWALSPLNWEIRNIIGYPEKVE